MPRRKRNPQEREVKVSDLLTIAGAAQSLRRSRSAVYQMVWSGRLRAYREPGGRRLFVVRQDIEELQR